MNKELLVDEAVVVGENIFFTAINESCIYKYDFISKEISKEKELSIYPKKIKRFISMVNYRNKIWMIPLNDKCFRVYDIDENIVKSFDIPKECIVNAENTYFRRVVQQDEYIWLIPNYADCIMQINMKDEEYRIFDNWPEDVIVKNDSTNFKSISYYNKKLHLFCDNCNYNIILDTYDGSMKKWDVNAKGEFGLVKDDKVIIAPVKTGDKVRMFGYNKDIDCFNKEIVVDMDVWANEEIYAFWYMESIRDKIYILPHEANYLLILNTFDLNIKKVRLLNGSYRNLYNNEYFAVEKVLKVQDEVVIVSYSGNQLIVLDKNDDIREIIHLIISEEQYNNDELKGFIDGELSFGKKLWKNERNKEDLEVMNKNIGKKIYSLLN